MRFRVVKSQILGGMIGWAACVAMALPAARAQNPFYPPPCANCPHPAPAPWTGPYVPNQPLMPGADQTKPTTPATPATPATPTTPATPATPTTPTTPNPEAANQNQNNANPNQNNADLGNANQDSNSNFSGSEGLASGAGSFAGNTGYIDSSIPQTEIRLRYNDAAGDNQPDRAEFFYARCGFTGPPVVNRNVNFQDYSTYLEWAPTQRFSVFVEAPERTVVPDRTATATGFADMNFGFKYAMIYDSCQVFSVQLRTFAPTGDPHRGLGTGEWAVEPSLLYHRKLTDRLDFDGEFRFWTTFPSRTPDYLEAGSLIRYGVGLSYELYKGPSIRVSPVAELVGWTILDGGETNAYNNQVDNVNGVTIVNAKIGTRFAFGDPCGTSLLDHSDIYLGYGRALTGAVWYKDMFRAEYRLKF